MGGGTGSVIGGVGGGATGGSTAVDGGGGVVAEIGDIATAPALGTHRPTVHGGADGRARPARLPATEEAGFGLPDEPQKSDGGDNAEDDRPALHGRGSGCAAG